MADSKKKRRPLGPRQLGQFAISMQDRPFVGADGVRTEFEGATNVGNCGLSRFGVERTGFEKRINLGDT